MSIIKVSKFIYKHKIHLFLVLSIIISGITFNYSLAFFKKEMIIGDVNLKIGELALDFNLNNLESKQLTLSANENIVVDISLVNGNSINTKYELYYKIIDGENYISGGTLPGDYDDEIGIIQASSKKKIGLSLKNTSPHKIILELGIKTGLVHNEVELETDEFSLNKIIKYQDDVYISNIKLAENNGSEIENSKINYYYQTAVNSDISLSKTEADSSVTYTIFVYNSSNITYYFDEVVSLGEENENIVYRIDDLETNYALAPKETKEFNVTYYYNNNQLSDDNSIESYLDFRFTEYLCPKDGTICDLSGNGNHANVIGATWDKDNRTIAIDGVDDYIMIDNIDWDDTTEFTVDFVAKIYDVSSTGPVILLESSIDSNNNYGSFYIDTNEYGTNDITLAMKYPSEESTGLKAVRNHKYVDNIIDNNNFKHYTITFNSMNEYDNFTKMYLDGVEKPVETTESINGGVKEDYMQDISGKKLLNYPFYIGARAGEKFFAKMEIKEVRLYNKELTQEEINLNYNGDIVKENLLLYLDFR